MMSIGDLVTSQKKLGLCTIVTLMNGEGTSGDVGVVKGDIVSVQPEDPFHHGNRSEGVIITLRESSDPSALRAIAGPLTIACGHCMVCKNIQYP